MRYLNKIVFINSASVKYAEIELDGNVHLIGTQGVGKSTLLRAILFFYNANKVKLGIPREKRGFDDYYFPFQNSYIIYEVIRDNVPYSVLAYKVNGKVAFRFLNSEYKSKLFIDESNLAYESWDKIRNNLGKNIHYSNLVTSYDEFRKIIYGDNKGLKPNFRKYAIIESKQFQNIPRTIQNVFLNSNLEAKFIKDTIIQSIDEFEFTIDIENYSKSHLRKFESEINDIKIWHNHTRKGVSIVKRQAEKIISKSRILNLTKRDTENLIKKLFGRINYIEVKKPTLSSDYFRENRVLQDLSTQIENLKETHKRREQKLFSEIEYVKRELVKAKDKNDEYSLLKVDDIIFRVSKKDELQNELASLKSEKGLLMSDFVELNQKYDALISQNQMQMKEFENIKNAEINVLNSEFSTAKEQLHFDYKVQIDQILDDGNNEREVIRNQQKQLNTEETKIKSSKAQLKYKTFYIDDIELCKKEIFEFNSIITKSKYELENSNSKLSSIRKEWEIEISDIERNYLVTIEKLVSKKEQYQKEIDQISKRINQSESSLYNWLNENYPKWETNIGKVLDENILFMSQLSPEKVDGNSETLFGIEINLDNIDHKVKSIKEYQSEIKKCQDDLEKLEKNILSSVSKKEDDLRILKSRYTRQIKVLNDLTSEKEYIIFQNQELIKKKKILFDELEVKAKEEKERVEEELEKDLEKIVFNQEALEESSANLNRSIKRRVTIKEKERDSKIDSEEEMVKKKINQIKKSINEKEIEIRTRVNEINREKTTELDKKGANIKRLNIIDIKIGEIDNELVYIKDNERIVFEYQKDKRELLDKVPQLKSDKLSLEKRQSFIFEEHKSELNKLDIKYKNQENGVKEIKRVLHDFDQDLLEFEKIKKSEIFKDVDISSAVEYGNDEINDKAVDIVAEIRDKYYTTISLFKDLQQAITLFTGNFNEDNIFSFKIKFNNDDEYFDFANDIKEFIEENKIEEFEKRLNERFAHIIHQIGSEITQLNSKEAEIEKIIRKINSDFINKNFVDAIKVMELRTQKSSNPIVRLLMRIKEFNDENILELGQANLFTSTDNTLKNQEAVELLKQLLKEIDRTKNSTLTLSESFDLEFRIVENDNDSGWVEKLSNVGSEGTDILIKAMINILLLNVFKDSASRKFKDFKLHCMMDEIGRLHPNNVRGILRFANERNILLINGSPTSQNSTDYKYTYKLAKEKSKSNDKQYITKVNRLIKVTSKALNNEIES